MIIGRSQNKRLRHTGDVAELAQRHGCESVRVEGVRLRRPRELCDDEHMNALTDFWIECLLRLGRQLWLM